MQGVANRTLLLLHGTGADEHDLIPLARALDPNASFLSPRGLWVENGMNRFFERYSDGSFNEDSIRQAVSELNSFLEKARVEYQLGDQPVIAVGFSNGANTAAAMLALTPSALSGAVLFGSTKPIKNVPIPLDLTGKSVWIANGNLDSYAPDPITKLWVEELRNHGAKVQWLSHPGGHHISPAHVEEISSQLHQTYGV